MLKKYCNSVTAIFTALFLFTLVFSVYSCKTTPKAPEEPSVTTGKKSPEVIFVEKLQAALEKGTVEDALLVFEKMPKQFESNYDIILIRASLLVSAKRYDEAMADVQLLEKLDPGNANTLVIKTMIAKATGNTKEKSKLLKEIVAADPNNSDAYVEMANDQMLGKRYKLAYKYYQQAVKNDPTNISAYFGSGQCLYYLGHLKAAEANFDRMLEINPKSAPAWAYKAKLDMENENYSEAAEKVKKAIEYDPEYSDYWIDYGRDLYYMGKWKDAEKTWTHAIELDPENILPYIYRSSLFDEQERFDEAIADYLAIIKIRPDYYYAYEALGIMYWHKGAWHNARTCFLKAYDYNKNNVSYPLMVSASFLKEGNEQANRSFMQKVLKNMDTKTTEYSVLRMYYDGVNIPAVVNKVKNEENSTLRGKYLYYIGLYYDVRGDDLESKKYYNEVLKMQAPLFFEYRFAEWSVKG
ncbi:MAG: tetratricopeptide repeat protein [Treponemataceae bacterium]|nr:tetratricopeptide repeat protein [Treponemataceae bacterium]